MDTYCPFLSCFCLEYFIYLPVFHADECFTCTSVRAPSACSAHRPTNSLELPLRYVGDWEPNPGPQQEQRVLLTTKAPLQVPCFWDRISPWIWSEAQILPVIAFEVLGFRGVCRHTWISYLKYNFKHLSIIHIHIYAYINNIQIGIHIFFSLGIKPRGLYMLHTVPTSYIWSPLLEKKN